MQGVVYDSLLKKDRRRMHERVARAVEELFPARLGEFSLLGNLPWIVANVPFAFRKANVYLREALENAEATGALLLAAQACLNLGILHQAAGRRRKAAAFFRRVEERCARSDMDYLLDRERGESASAGTASTPSIWLLFS